jgi:hypothetical protein
MSNEERNEYSEELRALALRFFSFTDEYRSERTEKYMRWSMLLKIQMEHLEELLETMRSCNSFERIREPDSIPEDKEYPYSDVASHVRYHLNLYSSQALFESIKTRAIAQAPWQSKYGGIPNAEAAAWLAYFCDWDREKPGRYSKTGGHVPNENWHRYYKEHFASNVDEKPKGKLRKKKT